MPTFKRELAEQAIKAIDPEADYDLLDIPDEPDNVHIINWHSDAHPELPTDEQLQSAYDAAMAAHVLDPNWHEFYHRVSSSPVVAGLLMANRDKPQTLFPSVLFAAAVIMEDAPKAAQAWQLIVMTAQEADVVISDEHKAAWNELIVDTDMPLSMLLTIEES